MKKLLSQAGPCPLKPRRHYFIILCEAIISQQLSTKAAATISKRVKTHFREKPTPEGMLKTGNKQLRSLGLSHQKITYLKDLSEKILEKKVILKFSAKESDEEIIERLTQIKGIGRWTVEMFLIFSLARPDVFSAGDLGLRQALKNTKLLKNRDDQAKAAAIAQRWAPHRTLASWVLWQSLRES